MRSTLILRWLAAAALACFVPCALAATAFVSLGGPGGSASQFRLTGGNAVRSFALPAGAVDMVLSADDARLYVGTTSVSQADVQGGSPSVVAVLDANTGAVMATFPMPGSVVKMVLNAAGDHLYASGVGTAGATLVMSLNLVTGAAASAPVPGGTVFSLYSITVSPDGATVFVPVNNQVAVFAASSLSLLGTVPLASNGIVAPPAVTLDNKTLLAAGAGQLYVIDIASRTLAKKLTIPTTAAAFGAALSPDGNTYWISAGTLIAIDVPSATVRATVNLGQTNPFRLGISRDGSVLYATDLTFGTTVEVAADSLHVGPTFRSIAPPYAVVVRANNGPLILNENGNAVARVDTGARSLLGRFAVGDSPGAGVFLSGKFFVPEVANVAVEETPDHPTPAKPIADNFIITDTAAALAGKVYANSGSAVKVIDPTLERATRSILLRVGNGGGGIGSALLIAASGDGRSLLASYVVEGFDTGPIDGGLVKLDAPTQAQQRISSFPFVPNVVASDRAGQFAYATSFLTANQVGRFDTTNNVFVKSALIAGSPAYAGLAVSADGSVVLMADQHGKVDVLDAVSLALLQSIPVGGSPSGIAISADGTQALVTDGASASVSVIDVGSRTVLGTVNVGARSNAVVFEN